MTLDLATRTAALEAAVEAGTGRLPADLVGEARAVVGRARERGGLSAEHTVVALAGATGSGKSSVLNALVGRELAVAGVQRPTTSHALAAVWSAPSIESAGGPDGAVGTRGADAGPLLDWLEVGRRHEMVTPIVAAPPDPDGTGGGAVQGIVRRAGGLRRRREPTQLTTGLVLLDLPDHDSVVVEHRVRAERLVERADLLVWVVDPQKYADAALHERYLRPLVGHDAVVVVVLNQIDRLTAAERDACLSDLRRLVAQDGLLTARVLGVSARTGEGLDELRDLLADAADRRQAANERLTADERAVGRRLLEACGEVSPGSGARARDRLVDALEDAAGTATVVDAVRASAARDAHAATGWPVTRWLGRFRRDPLRRLGLRPDVSPGGAGGTRGSAGRVGRDDAARADLVRTSLPGASASTRAAAGSAVRAYVAQATDGAPDAWVLAARARVADVGRELPDALDQAVAATRLEADRRPVWWRVVGVAQTVLLVALVAGLLWLGVLAGFAYLQLPPPPTPTWRDLPVPTLLAVGGAAGGILLALVSRGLAALGARRRAARARRRLRTSVDDVATRLVHGPVADELDALARCRAAATTATT
ncbi:GTPase [Oerskovia flava]|uniref:GTPase n=1 Tax=Oerskovia flava TaxID=2986422 RepID=UPI00223FBF72|nr:GTPase [Oerskovia sp. JB1-3-2]